MPGADAPLATSLVRWGVAARPAEVFAIAEEILTHAAAWELHRFRKNLNCHVLIATP